MKLDTDKMIAEKDGHIGWMIFNNPARRNAMSLEMWTAAATILDDFESDDNIRVIVMKGAGDKAFVSGADISQFEEKRANAEAAEEYSRQSDAARDRMASLKKPFVAMVRGFCLGGGLGVAMKADLRIVSDDSQFGIPAARLSIAYTFDNLRNLVDLVGPTVAKELLFTAKRINAQEALRIGLVNQVVSASELEATVRELAGTMADNAPLSIRASKLTINEVIKDPADRNWDVINQVTKDCFDSQDYAEGRKAFMEKRRPAFTGR